ncbi:BglG family transcription antiterminator [Bacillus toyonensis]|uniref:BglG family transcription antiterminator n=1 Tax=Bacillus toyonensis TaxID=155322 RepID=UPI000BF2A284|nr:helix-turn-helix domain-containing protein [Bacillus toyonensis]PGA72286.1 hypothetical protein COL90_28765 [Bacillus toyonensis]
MNIKVQSNIQRKMKLLELLASEKRWFKTDEITERIGYSNKTIHSDISFIHDFLPKHWHLEAKKGKGVQLHVPPASSIDEVNSFLFQQSYVFKALHELLDQKGTTVLNLADKLYVSTTSILPILKSVEIYLRKFNLQLNKRPLAIVGDEVQIIMLCYELHLEVYGYYEWPFQDYPESYFFNFIHNIEKALNHTLSLNSRKEICYFTTVLLKRKKQKNSIKLQEKFVSQYVNSSHYHKMASVYEGFKKEHHISWNTEEKVLLTMAIKCAKYILPDIEKEKEDILQHVEKEDIPIYNAIKNFIFTLETKLNRDLMHDEDLIFELMMYFRRKVYQLHFLSMFQRMEQHTSTYIEQKYSATFLTIQAVYTEWVKKYNITHSVPDVEVARVTMYIEASHLRQMYKSKKALLICGEGDSWGKYIAALLFHRFGNKLEIVNDYTFQLDDKEHIDSDIDFIISTIPLNINYLPIVRIEHIPTERNFMEVQSLIESDTNTPSF